MIVFLIGVFDVLFQSDMWMCIWQSVELFISLTVSQCKMAVVQLWEFTAVLQLWSSIPFEPCTISTWTCGPWEVSEMCFASTTAFRSPSTPWQSDWRFVGTDVQRKHSECCTGQQWLVQTIHKWTIINWIEEYTNCLFSLKREQTDRVSLTNQSNEWIELNTAPTVCSLNLDTELGANFPRCMLHEC